MLVVAGESSGEATAVEGEVNVSALKSEGRRPVGYYHLDFFKDKMKHKAFIWVHGLVFNQQ